MNGNGGEWAKFQKSAKLLAEKTVTKMDMQCMVRDEKATSMQYVDNVRLEVKEE